MIVKYKAELDAARHPVLVREQSYEYEAATMDSPEKIITMMNDCFHLSDMAEEYVYMLALNAAAAPVGVFEVSHGCVNYALIKPRELYIRALLAGAVGIVVVHNHTSGEVVPSREDISACAGMKAAGDMIGITFFDFIIAGKGKYLSFHEEGILERDKLE